MVDAKVLLAFLTSRVSPWAGNKACCDKTACCEKTPTHVGRLIGHLIVFVPTYTWALSLARAREL